ncbi:MULTISPECIES: ATP-binding protein [Streptomyces]|uniref:Orc1-like AAA ATPase domain-containing protein n=1 Tax=Streptomyces viridochromogenes TaxID=1938 RepID=A0A0L8LB92_STRVR|nr:MULTISPECIES: ATP-binding protein [Streptomyces]KOG35523.1 hypothetical protein ADK34_05305 [Streptomyces viridochromogenes]
MAELRSVTSAEITARLRARRARAEHTSGPPGPDAVTSSAVYREAAALLGFFDAGELAALEEPANERALRDFIVRDCERVSTPAGPRWSLTAPARTEALELLGDRDRLLGGLAAVRPEPSDTGRAMAEAYLRGTAPTVEAQTMDQLAGTLRLTEWLARAPRTAETLAEQGVSLPATDDVRRAIEVTAILQPMRLLADDHFVGRRAELELLSRYAENPEPLPDLAACRPVALYGPGGVGKSTVVSRFLLDRVGTAGRPRLPCCYLTFDRADLLPQLPLTLLAEAAHQLGLLYPAAGERARSLEWAVRGTLLNASAAVVEGSTGPLPDYLRDDEDGLIRRFADFAETALAPGTTVPLVMVLDTMERAQRQGPDAMARLWGFLDRLQHAYPLLRLVFAGRSRLDHPTRAVSLPGLEPALAVEYLGQQLAAAGVRVDREFLRRITGRIGENPLSLRLAAEVVRREGEGVLRDDEVLDRILSTVEDEEVQAVLYRRVLDHLEHPDLKKLASPGLTLRRITPDVIRHVLAVPCELGEVDEARARHLFEMLAGEGTLMDRVPGEQVLVHRADVRRATLPLLLRDKREATRGIHHLAVDYYAAAAGLEARAEELYHRLALGQDTVTLDERWTPEAGALLDGALDELPPSGRVYLADRLGLPADLDTLTAADSEVWTRQTVRRSRVLLASGKPSTVLALLRERPEEGRRTEIVALEVEALAALGLTAEALDRAAGALRRAVEAGDASGIVDVTLLAAKISEDLTEYADALALLERARRMALALPDRIPHLRVDVAQLRVLRRSGAEGSDAAAALRTSVLAAANELSRHERLRHPTLVRDLAAEVGDRMPGLVSDTARLLGVTTEGKAGVALGEALTADDIRDFASETETAAGRPAEDPTGTLPVDWQTYTSGERGEVIAAYLDTTPEHGPEWTEALVKSYRAEADEPAFERRSDEGDESPPEGA